MKLKLMASCSEQVAVGFYAGGTGEAGCQACEWSVGGDGVGVSVLGMESVVLPPTVVSVSVATSLYLNYIAYLRQVSPIQLVSTSNLPSHPPSLSTSLPSVSPPLSTSCSPMNQPPPHLPFHSRSRPASPFAREA